MRTYRPIYLFQVGKVALTWTLSDRGTNTAPLLRTGLENIKNEPIPVDLQTIAIKMNPFHSMKLAVGQDPNHRRTGLTNNTKRSNRSANAGLDLGALDKLKLLIASCAG